MCLCRRNEIKSVFGTSPLKPITLISDDYEPALLSMSAIRMIPHISLSWGFRSKKTLIW